MPLEKEQLRRSLRQSRQALSLDVWQRDSALVNAQLVNTLQALPLRTVALYACMERLREVDLTAADPWLRSRGVRIAYPVMFENQRGFAWVPDVQALQSATQRFRQPPQPWQWAQPGELDVIIVPMLGFTHNGHRIGYGAGFYDEMLSRFRPPALAIGVAFEAQSVPTLPLDPHDQPCDLILTEQTQYSPLLP